MPCYVAVPPFCPERVLAAGTPPSVSWALLDPAQGRLLDQGPPVMQTLSYVSYCPQETDNLRHRSIFDNSIKCEQFTKWPDEGKNKSVQCHCNDWYCMVQRI